MVSSAATTVDGYLASLPAERRSVMRTMRGCVRFKSLDDLPLPALGAFIAATLPEAFIEDYESARANPPLAAKRGTGKPAAKRETAKSAAKRAAPKRSSTARKRTR